jgi:flagella basal body P-ring formation protein FlgA
LFGKSLFAACAALAALASCASAETTCAASVRPAIVEAVQSRMGTSVNVEINELSCATTEIDGTVVATPVPGARLGKPVRFSISDQGKGPRPMPRHAGEAVADVVVTGTFVRAARPLTPGTVLAEADVEATTGPIDAGFVKPLPSMETVIGGRVTRALAAGETIVDGAIAAVALVKSGDRVRVIVRMNEIQIEGVAVAAQSGALDQIIRVVNPDTRKAIKARVIGDGEVEVVQ